MSEKEEKFKEGRKMISNFADKYNIPEKELHVFLIDCSRAMLTTGILSLKDAINETLDEALEDFKW